MPSKPLHMTVPDNKRIWKHDETDCPFNDDGECYYPYPHGTNSWEKAEVCPDNSNAEREEDDRGRVYLKAKHPSAQFKGHWFIPEDCPLRTSAVLVSLEPKKEGGE